MPIKNLPKEVALAIQGLLVRIHKTDISEGEQLWNKKMFDTAIRHLEYFVEPLVSINAQKIADANGLGDLRLQRYRTPKAWRGGEELYWEHAMPVLDIRKALMQLGVNPSIEDILSIVSQAEIAWITRTEEGSLKKTGRSNWREEYQKKNIELLSPSNDG
jgi:hypothetical protein